MQIKFFKLLFLTSIIFGPLTATELLANSSPDLMILKKSSIDDYKKRIELARLYASGSNSQPPDVFLAYATLSATALSYSDIGKQKPEIYDQVRFALIPFAKSVPELKVEYDSGNVEAGYHLAMLSFHNILRDYGQGLFTKPYDAQEYYLAKGVKKNDPESLEAYAVVTEFEGSLTGSVALLEKSLMTTDQVVSSGNRSFLLVKAKVLSNLYDLTRSGVHASSLLATIEAIDAIPPSTFDGLSRYRVFYKNLPKLKRRVLEATN